MATDQQPDGTAAAVSPDCAGGLTLNVVAHEDDDTLFLNPDIYRDIRAGRCVVTAYITASDDGLGTDYWQGLELGAQAAYARLAGVDDSWTETTVSIAGDTFVIRTLDGRPTVRLLYLRLPDGNGDGTGFASQNYQSLQKLWEDGIPVMDAVDESWSCTKEELIAKLAAIMDFYQPDVIRTQDYVNVYGSGDHSDHYTTGRFTLEAHRRYAAAHAITSYLGYPSTDQPANLSATLTSLKQSAFLAYAAHDPVACQTPEDCAAIGYGDWFARQYTTGSEAGGAGNVAPQATVSASSEDTSTGQLATKAVDGVVAGYPVDPGHEWCTVGGKAGSWIQLTWPGPHKLYKIVLYDSPNPVDRVTAGLLEFSEGSSISVGALPNDGSAKVVTFTPRSVVSVRFTITKVAASTENVGLAEIQAFETS